MPVYDSTMSTDSKVNFVDREELMDCFIARVSDASTWISECGYGPESQPSMEHVICLAEISGACRLVKELLKLTAVDFPPITSDD